MQSFREPAADARPELKVSLPIPTDLLVSLASAPLLTTLVAGHAVARSLIQLGISSEELFRGDRMPTLPLLQHEAEF